MKHPLPNSAHKLDRAVTHFRALHDQIGTFVSDEKPFTYLPEIDVEQSRYVLRVEINKRPPTALSLIAGDFVQNLRAALDHLVWQLVKANGMRPNRGNAFPIHHQLPTRRNGGLDTWNRQLRGVHPSAAMWIARTQPYKRGNGATRDALTLLSRLSNEDKHRVVLQSVTSVPHPEQAEPRLDIKAVRDIEPIESYELHAMKPLKSGDPVVEVAIKITGPEPKIDVKGELPLDIAFGKSLIPLEGLLQIFDRIDVIVAFLANVTFGTEILPNPLSVRLGHETVEEFIERRTAD